MLQSGYQGGLMAKDVQFITDSDGKWTAVILSIEEYEEMLRTSIWAASPARARMSRVVPFLRSSRNYVPLAT